MTGTATKIAARPLWLPLLLLLVPTVAVGWLASGTIGDLEQALKSSLATTAAARLREGEAELAAALEAAMQRAVDELEGKPQQEVVDILRGLPTAGPSLPLIAGLLLDGGGQPLFPLPPLNRSVEPLQVQQPPGPKIDEALLRLRQAEFLAQNGDFLGALEHLESAKALPNIELQARFYFERGVLHRRLGNPARALDAFEAARREIEASRSPPRRLHGLWLQVRVALHETIAQVTAAEGEDPESRRLRVEQVLEVMHSIADGEMDGESDSWLDFAFQRLEQLVTPAASEEVDLQIRCDELRERHRDRIALRALLEDVLQLKGDVTAGDGRRLLTDVRSTGAGTTLLAFRRIELGDTSPVPAWLCLQFDLVPLVADLVKSLSARLADTGAPGYCVELLDARGRSLVAAGGPLREEQRRRGEPWSFRHPLGQPLLTLTLAATPAEPESIEAETRKRQTTKIGLLAALATVAGAGALLLVRTLRREAELSRLKTAFVGRVSHELKTPLALIKMYGETLAMGRVADPERVEGFAGIIAKEADRLTRLIDNVLDFSQIEAGTKVYQRTRIRLDEHLEDVLNRYGPHLEEQGFSLDWRPLSPVSAEVDAEGLTQAMVNLLSNAAKYTADDGEKAIEVELRLAEGAAEIAVLDRGVGVPTAERERVFETFYRASTAGERRGAGLGLALVLHFAQAHGGNVICEARDGGGSVFRLRLPAAENGMRAEEP